MRITADTNVLVRAFLEDHPQQSKVAQAALSKAELIALTTATFWEFVWCCVATKSTQATSPRRFEA